VRDAKWSAAAALHLALLSSHNGFDAGVKST